MKMCHCIWIGALLMGVVSSALAATRTWDGGAGDSNWFNAVNWDGDVTIPQDGDSVVITNNSQVWLTNATAWLDTFEITNAVFTFGDTTNLEAVLQATNVYIRNLGIVTHATNAVSTTNAAGGWDVDGRVYILCSNLVLDAGGWIKADGAGYAATNGGIGFGPGGGTNTYTYGGGGSYGGLGYWYHAGGPFGQTYGSASVPTYPGSAGGSANGAIRGGSGGGLVIVHASGHITINGTISVNGEAGDEAHGSGSGGGVYLECNTFGGSGLIRAIGGQGTLIDPGGGGRIAIVYTNSIAQAAVTPKPTVQFTAKCGHSDNYGWDAGNGTLYLPDSTFFPYEAMLGGFKLVMALTNWSPNALTISNGVIEFPDNCVFSVTNAVSLTNSGGILLQNGSALTCGVLRVASGTTATITNNTSLVTTGNMEIAGNLWIRMPPMFHCGGHLIVTNAGKLYLFSGLTNGASPDYGLLSEVNGDITVESNAYIYIYSHPTNGGSPLLTAANVRIAAGGRINADGGGYAGTTAIGLGPGGGLPYDADGSGGGGSYGGRGGCLVHTRPTYGSSNAPIDPGSAGGGYYNFTYGGNGGGLVKIRATGSVWVDGTISAAGTEGGHVCGGGSGGGIYIICKRFGGVGAIQAVGANGGNGGAGPGGGGGRIAIWRMYDTWSGALSYPSAVAGGTSSTAGWSGDPGTIFWGQVPPPGTIFTFR